jgi:co-chaperonin GroES (HSP10)
MEEMEIIDKRKVKEENGELIVDKPAIFTPECVYEAPKPIFNHILVKVQSPETNFAGTNFIIPESAQKRPDYGVVVAAGGKIITAGTIRDMSEEVHIGDLVTFNLLSSEDVTLNGEKYIRVSIFDVHAVERSHYAIAQNE